MEISTNIIANCSDFVWSLNKTDINIIRDTLKKIEEVTNFMLCVRMNEFSLEEQMYIQVTPDMVDIYENDEDKEYVHDDIGVDIFKLVKSHDSSVTEENYKENEFFKKYCSSLGEYKVDGKIIYQRKREHLDIMFIELYHLPNEEGVFKIKGYLHDRELRVSYQDGYCDKTFVIVEDQPQGRQLKFYGEVLKNVGGTYHHEDGGASQADWHAKWFKDNGYESILELGDGDPDNCDEDT